MESLVSICTRTALLVSFATTLMYAQDEVDYHGLYASLQSLPEDVCSTAACAQWYTSILSWGVDTCSNSNAENSGPLSLIV